MEALSLSGLIFSVWCGSTWPHWSIRLEGPNRLCLSNGSDRFKKAVSLAQQHLRFTWTSSSFLFGGNYLLLSSWDKASSSMRPLVHRGFLKCLGLFHQWFSQAVQFHLLGFPTSALAMQTQKWTWSLCSLGRIQGHITLASTPLDEPCDIFTDFLSCCQQPVGLSLGKLQIKV